MRAQEHGLRGWGRILELYSVAVFMTYVLLILGHRSIPSLTDYANWTYQGVLLRDHLLGVPDPTHLLKLYPVPNSAATLGIGLLCLVVSWQMAAKLWLVAQLILALAAIRFFLRATGGEMSASMLGAALFLNLNLWNGFINFQMGMSWVLLLAALLVKRERQPEPRMWRDGAIGGLLLLTFFTHMLPFAFAGLLVILYAMQTRRFRLLWQLLPSAVACTWYVFGRYLLGGDADGQAGMAEAVRNYSAAFWAFKGNSYLKSLGLVNPVSSTGSALIARVGRGGFLLLVGVNLVLSLAVAGCLFFAARRALHKHGGQRFLWVGVVALVPLYLVAPVALLGISDPGSRLLQLSLTLGVLLAAEAWTRLGMLAEGCAAVLMTMDVVIFSSFAYGAARPGSSGSPLPQVIASMAHVANHDQDSLLRALEHGDESEPVFPTGMFLRRQ